MSLAIVERPCELPTELGQFTHIYWWLEYWGDWLGPGGDNRYKEIELSPLGKLIFRGKDYIAATGEQDEWNDDLHAIEKALARYRNREEDRIRRYNAEPPGSRNIEHRIRRGEHISGHKVLYMLHNRKWARNLVASQLRLHYRPLISKMHEAYANIEEHIKLTYPILMTRPAPRWE